MPSHDLDKVLFDSFEDGNFGLGIAYENKGYSPTFGTAYAELVINPNDIRGFSIGNQTDITDGIFKVILRYPADKGDYTAKAKADEILDYYTIGKKLSLNSENLWIQRKSRTPGVVEDGWYKIIVSLWYRAFLGR